MSTLNIIHLGNETESEIIFIWTVYFGQFKCFENRKMLRVDQLAVWKSQMNTQKKGSEKSLETFFYLPIFLSKEKAKSLVTFKFNKSGINFSNRSLICQRVFWKLYWKKFHRQNVLAINFSILNWSSWLTIKKISWCIIRNYFLY